MTAVKKAPSRPVLEFKHHVHPQDGALNNMSMTVRKGTKWGQVLTVGDLVELAEVGKKPDKLARVTAIAMSPFGEIPTSWLRYEHDEKCRTFPGLREVMEAAYGKGEVNYSTPCTLVFYELLEDGD